MSARDEHVAGDGTVTDALGIDQPAAARNLRDDDSAGTPDHNRKWDGLPHVGSDAGPSKFIGSSGYRDHMTEIEALRDGTHPASLACAVCHRVHDRAVPCEQVR